MELRKTVCLYHSDQIITNFCKDKNCLMPLCPSCIGQHSLYHERNNTKPQYNSINEIMLEVQNLIYNSISALEKDKKRTTQLTKKINSLNDLINEKCSHAKHMVYRIIEDAFKELQNQLKNSLCKLHDQIGVFSLKKTEKMQENLAQTLKDLYELNDGMSYIIVFLKQKQKDSQSFHAKINGFLDSNQNYCPKLDISNEATTSIINNIGRIIKIEGKRQFDRRKQTQNESRTSIFKNKQNNKDYYQKNEKIERSYTPKKSTAYSKSTVQLVKSKGSLSNNNSAYIPSIINNHYVPRVGNASPYNDQKQMLQKRYLPQTTIANPNNHLQTNRIRDFKQEYDILSRKISQMRRENQLVSNYR